MSNKEKSVKVLSKEELKHEHECLNCNFRNQRFIHEIPKVECATCRNKSNFIERKGGCNEPR